MSITPVDKSPDGNDDSGVALSNRSWSIRSGLERVFSWVAEWVASVRHTLAPATEVRARDPALARQPDSSSRPGKDAGECGSIDGFPNRDHPLTFPGRNLSGINTPDVVSLETEEGLRLSVPENPEAQLTSDIWMTVER